MEVVEVGRAKGLRVGLVGPLVVMVFDDGTSLEQMDALEKALEVVISKQPKYSAFTMLQTAVLEKPPSGLNKRAQAIEDRFEKHIVSKAMVVVPSGLSAVIIRSFLAAQSLMARAIPTKVFRTADAAAEWFQALPEQLPEIKAMRDLAGVVRAFASKPTSAP